MISHLNYVLTICATLVCIGLYTVKYDAQQAERSVSALSREIAQERDQLRLLQAEWALRTKPERLERLAGTHLSLAPVRADQIVSLADLPAFNEAAPEPAALPGETAPQEEPRAAPAMASLTAGTTQTAAALTLPVGLGLGTSVVADAGTALARGNRADAGGR